MGATTGTATTDTAPATAAGPATAGGPASARELGPAMGAPVELIDRHLALAPAGYLGCMAPRAVVRHAIMAAEPLAHREVRTRVTRAVSGPDAGGASVDGLDVVALDRPGWFSTVAGVLTMHGGSILSVDAFTRGDGVAIDTYRVEPPVGAGGSWWARVEGDLQEAAHGRLAVRARVQRALARAGGAGPRPARRPFAAGPDQVQLATRADPGDRCTIVEVDVPDRAGVLYAITSAFVELQLDIVTARVTTRGGRAEDRFTVRHRDGWPVSADHLVELELAIAGALALR